jgi:hypothetical protein
MWARIRSTPAGWAAAPAAQRQSRSAGAGLKIVLVFFLVAFSSQDYDCDEDHRENAGDELDRSLGHVSSWSLNRKYKTKHGHGASCPLNRLNRTVALRVQVYRHEDFHEENPTRVEIPRFSPAVEAP